MKKIVVSIVALLGIALLGACSGHTATKAAPTPKVSSAHTAAPATTPSATGCSTVDCKSVDLAYAAAQAKVYAGVVSCVKDVAGQFKSPDVSTDTILASGLPTDERNLALDVFGQAVNLHNSGTSEAQGVATISNAVVTGCEGLRGSLTTAQVTALDAQLN